jgi:hypothetical protein
MRLVAVLAPLLPWLEDGVMTARPTAFEEMLRAHHIPEACG